MQKTPLEECVPRPTDPADAMSPHRFYRWELLALLFVAFFFHQGDRAIFGVVLSAIKSDLHLTDAQLGMVGTVLFMTLAILMPLTGYIGDIWSRKWIITASVTFWSVATMATGMARGLIGLVMFRSVATAGGESFYAPAAYSLIAQYHKKTRSLALSIHQASLYLGVITSGFLGGYLAELWGWRSAFYVFGGCGVLLGVVLMFRLKDARRETLPGEMAGANVSFVEALSRLFRTPTAVLLTIGFTAIVFVNNAYVVWAPNFVQEKFNLSLTVAGGGAMLWHHLAAMIGVLIGGRMSDMMILTHRSFRLQLQMASMLLGVPTILWMGFSGNLMGTWAAMGAFGLCRGLYESNTHASLFDVIPSRYRGSAVAMMTMTAFLIGSLSPWFLGFCSEYFAEGKGLSYGFALLSLAYLIGGLAVFVALNVTFRRDLCEELPSAPERRS